MLVHAAWDSGISVSFPCTELYLPPICMKHVLSDSLWGKKRKNAFRISNREGNLILSSVCLAAELQTFSEKQTTPGKGKLKHNKHVEHMKSFELQLQIK